LAITATTLRGILYPPERLVDATIASIAAGATISPPPLYLQGIYDTYGLVARLEDITTDQTPSVNLVLGADARQLPGAGATTGAVAIAQRPLGTPGDTRVTVKNTVSLNFQNVGASTTANPVRSDWALWVWRPTVADKLLLGIPLTPEETELWRRVAPPGYVPRLTPDLLWLNEYAEPDVIEWAGTANVGTATNVPVNQQATVLAQYTPRSGRFAVVAGIYVDASIGGTVPLGTQVSNALTVNIDRDDQQGFRQYPAAGVWYNPWGSVQHGTLPRIVGLRSVTVYLTASAALTGVPYRVVVHEYPLMDVHRARWGIDLSSVPQQVIDQVRAGVL
jgi:hypothetical protein